MICFPGHDVPYDERMTNPEFEGEGGCTLRLLDDFEAGEKGLESVC